MQKKQKKPKGLPKRTSNPARQARRHRHYGQRAEKTLRHLLQRNGDAAARSWAETHGELARLQRMLQSREAL